MRSHRAMALVAVAILARTCDGEGNCTGSEPDDVAQTAPVESDPGVADGGPQPSADDTSDSAPEQPGESAFVPRGDDLIVRLVYGDAMDGPGWYEVTILDPDAPMSSACQTKIETASPEGLSAFGAGDYTCLADVFNANSEARTDPDEFVLIISSSLGYDQDHVLTYDGGAFANEVGNVITYDVP